VPNLKADIEKLRCDLIDEAVDALDDTHHFVFDKDRVSEDKVAKIDAVVIGGCSQNQVAGSAGPGV